MAVERESREWEEIAAAFGSRVTQERERQHLTKEALGQRSGLASRYIWRVEAGQQNLQLGNVSKIARGLDIKIADLLDGVEELITNPLPKALSKPRGKAAVKTQLPVREPNGNS